MTGARLALPAERRIAVLDIEPVPCGDALFQAHPKSRGGYGRHAMHRIVYASVLVTKEHDDGFLALDVRTFHDGQLDEAGIIGFVDLMLPDSDEPGARLVTYNGMASDLPILKHRACANWLFAVPALGGWCQRRGDHVDVMDAFGRHDDRWSLSNTCTCLASPSEAACSARQLRIYTPPGEPTSSSSTTASTSSARSSPTRLARGSTCSSKVERSTPEL